MEPVPTDLVVEGREELLYLLGEAAELEHAVFCTYLYAAFSLRNEPGPGLSQDQLPAVGAWKRAINEVALQEMAHLALVNNLLAALGGAPRLGRHNLPQRSPYAPEIQLTLAPFSEPTLRRFLHIERPEGMDVSTMAGHLDGVTAPPPAAVTGPVVLPAPQAFASVGQLYHGIERGLVALVERYGERQVFVGSPNTQAIVGCFRRPERMPELIPVTDLASAVRAIETIVEEGEGARGAWEDAHFGRFVGILREYRKMTEADPGFSPVWPSVANPYVRVPRDLLGQAAPPVDIDDPFALHLVTDPYTAAVSDLFNACYALMLQLLYRFFQHTEETDAELGMLGDTSVQMMRQVIRPLGELLARLPVGQGAPGRTAGPSFMVTSATPVTPHKPAAWTIIHERLLELSAAAEALVDGAPQVLGRVAERLAAYAKPLAGEAVGGAEPQPEEGSPVPSFATDIAPLFRERDRAAMAWAFDLAEAASVRQHAEAILDQVASGQMPCDAPWPPERVDLFRRWVRAGAPD